MQKEEIIRSEIIEEAGRLFQQYGLHKTTMEDIAKSAGKGKSTLYYYFSNKNEVFEAVVMKEIGEVAKAVDQAVMMAETPSDKLRAYAVCNFHELKSKAILYQLVCGDIKGNLTDLMFKLREQFDHQDVALFKNILTLGVESGDFKSISLQDVDILARTIVSAFRGVEMDLFIENKWPGFEERIDLITGMVVRGLL